MMTTNPYAIEGIEDVKLLIDGKMRSSTTDQWLVNRDPATGQAIARVPLALTEEIQQAATAAEKAFFSWKETPVMERARVMLRLQALIRDHIDELAGCICQEQGKTYADAKADVARGLEVVEFASQIPTLLMGESIEQVGRGIDTYSLQQPLGVCLGITPFNFPAMIPLWMFPIAIACGNAFILKPSEQAPMTAMMLGALATKAGVPPGVLNIVHGGQREVEQLIDIPEVVAISFVGSAPVGRAIYERATKQGKRAQALLGAKNHAVIMPDAHSKKSLSAICGAAFGASGQRCMAISVAIFVGKSSQWIGSLVEIAKRLNAGDDFGPLISTLAKERVESLIQSGVDEGATLLLDGRGEMIGPTIFSNVIPAMSIYKEEIFGPVLSCLAVDTLEDALAVIASNPYGNGASIFTESGAAARKFQHEADAGQIGINIPIPVPLPFFSFTGWGASFLGDLHAYGKHSVRFNTKTKTITSRWHGEEHVSTAMPLYG